MKIIKILLLILLPLFCINAETDKKDFTQVTVQIKDAKTVEPLQFVNVVLKNESGIYKTGVTDKLGNCVIKEVKNGKYELSAIFLGYQSYAIEIVIDSAHSMFNISLAEKTYDLEGVTVVGLNNKNNTSIDINTGSQVYTNNGHQATPSVTMNNLIQENLAGAVKAPTGEVHIRGQHGEFTYYIDGLPIPLGVFGGLNEIIDPAFIYRMTFYTAGFPAEYGGQIAAIVDIQNLIPPGGLHFNATTFAGTYLTENSSTTSKYGALKHLDFHGEKVSISSNYGNMRGLLSFALKETDRRIDLPSPDLAHDNGLDYTFYSKLDYILNDNNYLTSNINFSKTKSQIPFNALNGFQNDEQNSYNSFVTLSYYGILDKSLDKESDLFIGGFVKGGGLVYDQAFEDDSKIYLNKDTTKGYLIYEDKNTFTYGIRSKYTKRFSHEFQIAGGFNYFYNFGKEEFKLRNYSETALAENNKFTGYDFGTFVQTELHFLEFNKTDVGLRYDIHKNSTGDIINYLSPRVKTRFFLNDANIISFSYDKLFMPSNLENIGKIAALFSSESYNLVAEKQDLYEIAFLSSWTSGISTKAAYFYKYSKPGIDDQTLESSTVRLNVNINEIKTNGFEFSLVYDVPDNPLSGYMNMALIHAYGIGPLSAGFLPADSSISVFDLDHDQRLTYVLGLNYQAHDWFANLVANYNSGLTNGNSEVEFKTGLFDFNQAAKTTPSWIFDVSFGYKFSFGKNQTLETSIYINNIFDHSHLIKGSFFSAASYEERRNIMLKLEYHI